LDSEIQIFQNALDFSEVKTREAMVPRAEVIAVEESTSLEEIIALFISTGLSKIPVYKENIDHILGYVHAFEMMKKPKGIKNILMPVAYVPETMLVNDVLKLLTRQHKSIAVVIDEYGGTSGIVTVEDIVEELFGEIEDEYDTVDHVEKQIEEGVYDFSARLEVDYLNQKYNLSLPESEYYETLGGMIAYNIGQIPQKDEEIELSPYILKIKKVSATKIERIILFNSKNE
jgi:CBS domain containing-hemolysin-like protein